MLLCRFALLLFPKPDKSGVITLKFSLKKSIKSLVLTGGGSLLEGIEEYAQIIFDSKTRLSQSIPYLGLDKKYNKPQFSQTFGLMMYNNNDYQFDFLSENKEKIEKKSYFGRFSSWLDKYI